MSTHKGCSGVRSKYIPPAERNPVNLRLVDDETTHLLHTVLDLLVGFLHVDALPIGDFRCKAARGIHRTRNFESLLDDTCYSRN
jgi:hypothetical protein